MMGIPGSGKTTWIKKNRPNAYVCSADLFFENLAREQNKIYHQVFHFNLLGEAHGTCLKNFICEVREMANLNQEADVVVDNTNTKLHEIAPYITIAQAYRQKVEVLFMDTLINDCLRRQTHGVPFSILFRMKENLDQSIREWPFHWPKFTCTYNATNR